MLNLSKENKQMKSARFITSVFLFLFLFFSYINAQSLTGKIIVHVNGFKNNNGKARLLIFSTKEKQFFPKDKDKAYGKFVVPIKDNKVLFSFDNLPFGDYAISVHHDEDNNGKVNTNFIGIPTESLGASNDAKGFFGPPSFEKAKVTLNKEEISIVINLVN